VNTYAHNEKDALLEHGAVVVGSNGIGKSYIGEELINDRKSHSSLIDAQSLLHFESHFSASTSMASHYEKLIDREISAHIEQGSIHKPYTLVIDNSEILLMYISGRTYLRVVDAIKLGVLKLILLRNYFIRENSGYLWERERELASLLPKFELTRLSQEDSHLLATKLLRSDEQGKVNSRIDWLSQWSGGIPGLMYKLKPFVPTSPALDDCPDRLKTEISRISEDLIAPSSTRQSILQNAYLCRLEPYSLLDHGTAREVGFFRLIGLLDPQYVTVKYPFQGKFWEHVASNFLGKEVPDDDESTLIARNLDQMFRLTNFQQSIATELNCNDINLLPFYLERVIRNSYQQPNKPNSLEQFLIEMLGKIGLRKMLGRAGVSFNTTSSLHSMAASIIHSAEGKRH